MSQSWFFRYDLYHFILLCYSDETKGMIQESVNFKGAVYNNLYCVKQPCKFLSKDRMKCRLYFQIIVNLHIKHKTEFFLVL